jgi:hypothetical protein
MPGSFSFRMRSKLWWTRRDGGTARDAPVVISVLDDSRWIGPFHARILGPWPGAYIAGRLHRGPAPWHPSTLVHGHLAPRRTQPESRTLRLENACSSSSTARRMRAWCAR